MDLVLQKNHKKAEGITMDIFTTQLTRVVPVPIKPASLKVKALLKEAGASNLTRDSEHFENHQSYFTHEEDQYHSSDNESTDKKRSNKNNSDKEGSTKDPSNENTKQGDEEPSERQNALKPIKDNADSVDKREKNNADDKDKHLDLYA